MNISIPKIVKRVELRGYAEEFGEAYLEVWVNPPMRLLEKMQTARLNALKIDVPKRELSEDERADIERKINESYQEYLGAFSELLSQGSEETRLSVEDLKVMVEGTADHDPMFWVWAQTEIIRRINEHRGTAKKGWSPPC